MKHVILAINPGSTSTKIAVFEGSKPLFLKNITHPHEELQKFKRITDQYEYRKKHIVEELLHSQIKLETINAIVARGGLVNPIKSGVYLINDQMKADLRRGLLGEHASNLGTNS